MVEVSTLPNKSVFHGRVFGSLKAYRFTGQGMSGEKEREKEMKCHTFMTMPFN
jgi:hypothetical protein